MPLLVGAVQFGSLMSSFRHRHGVFREGLNLYLLPPLAVLLDAGRADGADVFFPCLRGGVEGLRRAGAAGAAADLFRPC